MRKKLLAAVLISLSLFGCGTVSEEIVSENTVSDDEIESTSDNSASENDVAEVEYPPYDKDGNLTHVPAIRLISDKYADILFDGDAVLAYTDCMQRYMSNRADEFNYYMTDDVSFDGYFKRFGFDSFSSYAEYCFEAKGYEYTDVISSYYGKAVDMIDAKEITSGEDIEGLFNSTWSLGTDKYTYLISAVYGPVNEYSVEDGYYETTELEETKWCVVDTEYKLEQKINSTYWQDAIRIGTSDGLKALLPIPNDMYFDVINDDVIIFGIDGTYYFVPSYEIAEHSDEISETTLKNFLIFSYELSEEDANNMLDAYAGDYEEQAAAYEEYISALTPDDWKQRYLDFFNNHSDVIITTSSLEADYDSLNDKAKICYQISEDVPLDAITGAISSEADDTTDAYAYVLEIEDIVENEPTF